MKTKLTPPTTAIRRRCNRCNASHPGTRCKKCGSPEFRLVGKWAAYVREEAKRASK